MPGEPAVLSPKTTPVTRRSSIRHSLNLASVGRAFADVINKDKDTKDTSKPSKKIRDSRRLSAQPRPSAPRASMGDTRSPSQATIRTATPDSKGTTRRRVSTAVNRASADEQPPKPDSTGSTGILTRAATLRAKNPNLAVSSLPKYRPRSAASEHLKPPSPVTVRAGTRRRFSGSDEDEKEDKQKSGTPSTASSAEKGARPISPLPQRAALKALNITPNPTPPAPTKKIPAGTPTSNRGSPTRPAKTSKTSSSASAVSRSSPTISTNPRPPSSSSSSSIAPQTPKTPMARGGLRRATQDKNKRSSPSATPHPDSPTPPARHGRSQSKVNSPCIGNMSHISEGVDEDEDELEDVELLLAPVAKLGAPTPAMPRIQKSRSRKPPALPPKTPTRGTAQLPTRSNMSYLSPLPPGDGDSNHLRPPQPRQLGDNARSAGRGSILSWEQLASEASKTLGEDELEKMLADIPAPFRSGAASPVLSATLEIPASPCLSALDSPTGYGSISQVLLPDVTPSPAMHGSQRYNLSMSSEKDAVNSPVTTFLRLQLAQAENMAKERLMQMQAMEQEIYSLKETHARNGEEHMAYTSSLEDRLRHAEVEREQAVKEAKRRSEESVRRSCDLERRQEKTALEARCTVRLATSGWSNVKDLTEAELDLVQGDRAVLSVLLAELDQLAETLSL